jgi:hypothetical protein
LVAPWQNDGKSQGVEQYGWSGKECLAQENFAGTKILFTCEKLLHTAAIPDRPNSLERFDQSWIHHGKNRDKIRSGVYSARPISENSHQAVLKCCGKNPLFHDNCMFNLPSFVRRSAIITAICVVLVLTKRESLAQAPYDAAARTALANEINQTYGTLVTPSLSITELFDIKNRLDKADSIARNYGVDLDYREHSFIELCDIESRIRLSLAINHQYGKNIDWREHGYTQLLEMEQQLSSQASTAQH